jgi:hypothetical protein
MECVGKALIRRRFARKHPALPGQHGRNRGDAAGVGELANRNLGVAVLDQDEIAALSQHQFARDHRRAIRVGLVVLDHELHAVVLAADLQAVLDIGFHALVDPGIGLGKGRADPGQASDPADLERARRRAGYVDQRHIGRGGETCRARRLENAATIYRGSEMFRPGFAQVAHERSPARVPITKMHPSQAAGRVMLARLTSANFASVRSTSSAAMSRTMNTRRELRSSVGQQGIAIGG